MRLSAQKLGDRLLRDRGEEVNEAAVWIAQEQPRLLSRRRDALVAGIATIVSEILADWAELQLLRRNSIAEILERVPDSALRPGLTRDAAVDTAWLITSPESYDLLVRRRHYSPDEFQTRVTQSLTTTLLDPSGR
ncbi:hypothetical protein [Parafrigoribacterium humi]|uniref:hypothetical protein n=1 Tax=Parafrigoribacterium humi TaxID=3144664 RepID=UPI0032F0542B